MIEKYFQSLYEIGGVDAIVLLDNINRVIDSWGNKKYDPSIFTEIGESYLQIFGIDEHSGFGVEEIVVSFDRGLIFVRNHSDFILIVIASVNVDVSYLRLAVNVSISGIRESKKTQKILRKLPSEKPSRFGDSRMDDNERSMINKIMENRDAPGRTD